MPAQTRSIAFTREEVHVLYALAGRDLSGCVLDGIGGGIAGPHTGHKDAVLNVLAKLGDAARDWTPDSGETEGGDR